MGLFSKILDEIDASIVSKSSAPNYIPYNESCFYNKDFLSKQKRYYNGMNNVENQWSVLYNLKSFEGELAAKYIRLCRSNIKAFNEMDQVGKQFRDYESPVVVPSYKRLAMIYEKQKKYAEAYKVCIDAIKNGISQDGTKAGMKGRAARMLKKAKIVPDEEILDLLTNE